MSRIRVSSRVFLLLICCSLLVIPASAQHFQQVTGFTGSMTQVAAGRSEVWGINTPGNVFRLVGSKFVPVSGALSKIAVGGGTAFQNDEIWGLDESGNIFHFNYGTKSFTQFKGGLTDSLAQIAVGEGYNDGCHAYEVWGINFNQNAFRYNYCNQVFEGLPINLLFQQVSTAAGAIWGLNNASQLLAYNFGTLQFQNTGQNGFTSFAADGNDVWVLSGGTGDIFAVGAFNGSYGASRINGTLAQLAAGSDGVWGIDSNQNIYRFDPAVGSFVIVPGSLTQIAVGTGAGVWGVDISGRVFTFVRT
jgi:hypothetical protein